MSIKSILIFLLFLSFQSLAVDVDTYIVFQKTKGSFPIAEKGKVSAILMDKADFAGAIRAGESLQADIQKVTGIEPLFSTENLTNNKQIIIIGTLGKNQWIDQLVKDKKLNISDLQGKWEKFQTQIIENPFKGVERALVIVGSDKRGTIYGAYDIAEQIGVSPWHWWADVPVKKHADIFVQAGNHTKGEPKVKYRGIFINDEAPALSGWTNEKNGGFNHKLYEKVFELILRMKGNYLWPAMWGSAFQVDDPMNPVLADEYGIVIGTSHHEPLMRAHDEWRRYGKDKGKWDYAKNDSTLREFWKESMQQRFTRENIVSVGMRGDGDEPMSRETATNLLEKIVTDQRKIISEVTGKDASETPQLWALYKEVQDYYDKGMRVPDDVTLLLCDDNWGNVRKLPNLDAKPRKGGYGIYYHFDYVGGPRNYKWMNTNMIPRIWEQMNLAYQYDARQIWIVNVGDIKPMELPISFFLDQAWNPEKWNADNISSYTTTWARKTFGDKYAKDIADFVDKYAKYNARCKPELLSLGTYSLDNYNEFQTVVSDYNSLAEKAQKVYNNLDAEYKDAYYQLVLFPILACDNLNELYYTVALNRKYAKQGLAEANVLADKAEALFKKDAELSEYFNTKLANGKWNHFADQTHIGYTYWQQPNKNAMPKVERVKTEDIKQEIKKDSTQNNWVIFPPNLAKKSFVEINKYVSMEAVNFSRKINSETITWKTIPDIGRTGHGITMFPVNFKPIELTKNSPHLEYDMNLSSEGATKVSVMLSPTLEFNNNVGLKYAISIDDETPQIVEIHKDRSQREWNKMVAENIKVLTTTHTISSRGKHTLKFWAIDPAVILQKIVVDFGGVKPSYLGPPESLIMK
jgi:hypothetical protein